MTQKVKKGDSLEEVKGILEGSGFKFPLIAKPDVGERGFKVEKIDSFEELAAYLASCPTDFLLQDFIDLPMELGILYYRFPGEKTGKISSVTIKEFLTVQGDGTSTVGQLIEAYPRAKLQYKALKKATLS